jgi:transcriptional regulator with XRE-family HTH domain
MAKVTEAFEKARKEAGLSQRQVAAALGISAPFMNEIIHGRRELGWKHYPNLPPAIRGPVIDAAQAELMEQAEKLEAMR